VAIVRVIVWALKDRRPWPRKQHLKIAVVRPKRGLSFSVQANEQDGMDRQPTLPAAILERGSVRCRHEDRAVGSHTRLRIESSV
jgi:hypothetical protein